VDQSFISSLVLTNIHMSTLTPREQQALASLIAVPRTRIHLIGLGLTRAEALALPGKILGPIMEVYIPETRRPTRGATST
jgi:hypothetical protein